MLLEPDDPSLKVSALGGGHGLYASLSALRRLPLDLTAVVTVADDGGSSGRLRSEVDYVTIAEIFETGLHEYLIAIQERLVEVSEAMYASYCASLGAA